MADQEEVQVETTEDEQKADEAAEQKTEQQRGGQGPNQNRQTAAPFAKPPAKGPGSGPSSTKPKIPTREELSDDPDELKSELIKYAENNLKLRNENAERRRKQEDAEKDEERKREALLSEQDKTQRKLTRLEEEGRADKATISDLRSQLDNTLVDHEIEREALKQGFQNPSHAPRLVDRDRLEIDPETRKVSGAKAVVEKFLKDYPEYGPSGARGGTGPARPAPNGGLPSRNGNRPANNIDPHEQDLRAMGKASRM
jgi:hypothetical protein